MENNLKNRIAGAFKFDKDAKTASVTSDNNVFTDETKAKNWTSRLADKKIQTYKREGFEKQDKDSEKK